MFLLQLKNQSNQDWSMPIHFKNTCQHIKVPLIFWFLTLAFELCLLTNYVLRIISRHVYILKIILVTLNKLIYDFRNICGCLTLNEILIKLVSLIICSINNNLTNTSSTPNCFEDHEIFAIKCEICLYNLTNFEKNYFSSICCRCVHLKYKFGVLSL